MFKVRDHSLLYFRNMRLPFYNTEVLKKDKEFIYRTATRAKEPNYPLLSTAIHYDQSNSKAYLLLESNRFFSKDSIIIAWTDPESKNADEFLMRTNTPENTLASCKRLSEYLSNEYDIYYRKGEGRLKLFNKKNDKKEFLTTMNDFIRLTNP